MEPLDHSRQEEEGAKRGGGGRLREGEGKETERRTILYDEVSVNLF